MSQTILITGASSGIGRHTARLFLKRGWNVIATMRGPEKESEFVSGETCLVTRLDVQDSSSIHSAVSQGIHRFGRIDVLLNNAGYGAYGLLEATPMDEVRRQMEVNVTGLIDTTKAILPHFRENQAGMVVNVSSIGGRVSFPLSSLYNASKFAVEGLTESLHYELGAIGVKVKLIQPGMTRTDFAGRSFVFSNDESMAEYQPMIGSYLEKRKRSVQGASDPDGVATAIYDAVTDGTSTLRYVVGEDAERLAEARASMDDESLLHQIRGRMMG